VVCGVGPGASPGERSPSGRRGRDPLGPRLEGGQLSHCDLSDRCRLPAFAVGGETANGEDAARGAEGTGNRVVQGLRFVCSAAAHGREVGEHMLRLFTEHAIGHQLVDETTTRELKLRESLVLRAVMAARTILREEGFTPNIPEKTFKRCIADKSWLTDYETYIGDNAYKRDNARKGSLNKEIGAAIRKGIGGVVDTANEKPIKVAVLDSIIQSYTQMASCNAVAHP
jgi:hypothetical protein